MNLTDRRRKLLFGGLVVVLAAIGVYLSVAGPGDGDQPDSNDARPRPTATATGPASPPPGIQGAVNPGDFDIYRLLPFSREEFATAADLAQRFVAAYGTYRYDEPPETYAGRLSALTVGDLGTQLARDASTPGILDERRREQVVAQSTASVDQVRDIADNSIIFVVTGRQQLTKGGTATSDTKKYAVTVARDAGALKIYSFQPADQGQAGDTG